MPVSYGASRVPYGNNSTDSDETPETVYPKQAKKKGTNKASEKRVKKNLLKTKKHGK